MSASARFSNCSQLLIGQRRQAIDAATGEQGRDYFKGRVLRGGPDQTDGAALDIGEKCILLGLVEAVNLIDKENGPRSEAGGFLRVRHHLLDLLDAAQHRGEFNETGLRSLGDDLGQRGLADSGRAPQNHGSRIVALDFYAQGHAGTEQLLLANVLIQRAGTHAFGERRGARSAFLQRAFFRNLAKEAHAITWVFLWGRRR